MPLTLSAIEQLLPAGYPPVEPSDDTRRRFGRIEGGRSNPLARAYLWSRYVTAVYRDYLKLVFEHFEVNDPASVYPSVGFFPIDAHVYTYASQLLTPASQQIGYFFGAVLYDPRWRVRAITPVALPARFAGSVVQFPISFVPHAPLDPVNAASSAWARTKAGAEGVLTCKHAIAGLSRGNNVLMKNGRAGLLSHFADGAVDAAFIEVAGGIPVGHQRLGIEDHPIIGASVIADFRSCGPTSTQILNAWYYADNPDPYNAWRVIIETWGQGGDSGSLVSTTDRSGVAIYTGLFRGNNTSQGICQYMRQAVDLMDLELFT